MIYNLRQFNKILEFGIKFYLYNFIFHMHLTYVNFNIYFMWVCVCVF